jgi:uncharacterized protein (TIGR00255 family)
MENWPVTVASMTGFARREGGDDTVTWTWEAKSVNAKGLDVRVRLPTGLDALEPKVRTAAQAHLARGNLSVNLNIDRGSRPMTLQVNRDLLDQLLDVAAELQGRIDAAPPRVDGLLNVRGVLETVETPEGDDVRASREAAMAADLDALLAELAAVRRDEGARMKAAVLAHLDEIARLAAEARTTAEAQPEALRERMRRQVAELLDAEVGVPEDRLAQEAAILANKSDVREELDRLDAHEAAAREMLDGGGVIGRKLDFLCQEFNREANTLCSKAQDVALTRIGLALKNSVEQLREQVQNIE